MKRLLVFLFCTFTVCCIVAALMGANGYYLLNGAAVLLFATWSVALWATVRDPLKGHQK